MSFEQRRNQASLDHQSALDSLFGQSHQHLSNTVKASNFDPETGFNTVKQLFETEIMLEKSETNPRLTDKEKLTSIENAMGWYAERDLDIPKQLLADQDMLAQKLEPGD